MKPVVIIAISVGCSVVAVLVILALSDTLFKSEEEKIIEEVFKEVREKNKADIEMLKQMCYGKYESGKPLQDCLREVEMARQEIERLLTP